MHVVEIEKKAGVYTTVTSQTYPSHKHAFILVHVFREVVDMEIYSFITCLTVYV